MRQESTTAQILRTLVSIPSVNPSLPAAPIGAGEGELADYVECYMGRLGLDVVTQDVVDGRHNVIGHMSRGPVGPQGTVLLSAHMDTYPPSDLDQLTPRTDGASMYGRGAADAKGALAAQLDAASRVLKSRSRREAFIVASVDEEYGLHGARALTKLEIHVDLAVTGEPTQLVPIVTQKGVVRSAICAPGDVSHAAYPSAKNALFCCGELLRALASYNIHLASSERHSTLSPSTITPINISTGGRMNATPAEALIHFDGRFLPGRDGHEFLADMAAFICGHSPAGLEFQVRDPYFISPPNECPLDVPLVQQFFACIEATTGHYETASFSYGSEAGILAEMAGASLVFGPGDPRYSHAPGELIDLRELEVAAAIYVKLLDP